MVQRITRSLTYASLVAANRLMEASSALATRVALYKLLAEDTDTRQNIFIVTYPRSGTTWMQMIVHLVLHDGCDYFRHISDVSTFLEIAVKRELSERTKNGPYSHGLAMDQTSRKRPRVFKTHLRYGVVRRYHGKSIYVVRDVQSVLKSAYRLFNASHSPSHYQGFADSFIARGIPPSGLWSDHVADALMFDRDDRLLLLTYDQMKSDLTSVVRRVAGFLNIAHTAATIDAIVAKSSLEYMKINNDRFDPVAVFGNEFVGGGQRHSAGERLTARQYSALTEACRRSADRAGIDPTTLLQLRQPDLRARISVEREESQHVSNDSTSVA